MKSTAGVFLIVYQWLPFMTHVKLSMITITLTVRRGNTCDFGTHTHHNKGITFIPPDAISGCLFQPRHGLRSGAAYGVYIIILINVFGTRGQPQRDLTVMSA